MAISRDQVDEIKSRVSIIDVAAERVNLSRHGSTMSCCCPFHQEKTPSCVLYEKTNSFYCFGCGTSGDVISFIRGTDNLSYVEAVQQLAQRAGITIDAKGAQLNQREQELRDRIRACNREAARYFFRSLTQDDEGSVGRTYLLNERGLSIYRRSSVCSRTTGSPCPACAMRYYISAATSRAHTNGFPKRWDRKRSITVATVQRIVGRVAATAPMSKTVAAL